MKNILAALFIVICLTGSSCNEKHQEILRGGEVDTAELKKICIDTELPGESGESVYRNGTNNGYAYAYQSYYETDSSAAPSWAVVFTLLNGHQYKIPNEHVLYIRQ